MRESRGLILARLLCAPGCLLAACGDGTTMDPQSTSEVARVILVPDSAVIDSIGRTTRFTATAYDSRNRVMAAAWVWGVSPLATIDNGLVTGLREGQGRVIAAAGGKADTSVIVVVTP